MKPQLNYVLAAVTGLLLVLIQPAPSLTFLAPFALLPLLLASANEASDRQRFLFGWLAGIIQWGATCYWIRDTLTLHGGMPSWLATLLFVLFALAKGLHFFHIVTGVNHSDPLCRLPANAAFATTGITGCKTVRTRLV